MSPQTGNHSRPKQDTTKVQLAEPIDFSHFSEYGDSSQDRNDSKAVGLPKAHPRIGYKFRRLETKGTLHDLQAEPQVGECLFQAAQLLSISLRWLCRFQSGPSGPHCLDTFAREEP